MNEEQIAADAPENTEEVEGHRVSQQRSDAPDEDVEGHRVSQQRGDDPDDDVEGHRWSPQR